MFIEELSNQEKEALMSLLVEISKADGNLSEIEINFLSKYASEYGITLDLEQEHDINKICGAIDSKKGKIIVIQELVKLAIVDGNYDESEKNGISLIANMLNVDLSKVKEIEEWVVEGQEWINKGFNIVHEELAS